MSRTMAAAFTAAVLAAPWVAYAQGPITTSQLTVSQPSFPGLTIQPAYQGQNFPGVVLNSGGLVFTRNGGSGAGSSDVNDVFVNRSANYTGGAHGFVNSPMRLLDTVSPGVTAYEWSLSSIMDNSSTAADASENVAGYFHTYKRSSGASWATTEELDDFNANPTTSTVTDEKDLSSVGDDSGGNGARVIEDIFAKSNDGNPTTVSWGIRLNAEGPATIAHGIRFNGNFGQGIDFTGGSISGGSIVLGDQQKICFDGSTCSFYFWRADGVFYIHTSLGNVVSIDDTGKIAAPVFGSAGGTGVNCSGPPSASFTVSGGIVTHC